MNFLVFAYDKHEPTTPHLAFVGSAETLDGVMSLSESIATQEDALDTIQVCTANMSRACTFPSDATWGFALVLLQRDLEVLV